MKGSKLFNVIVLGLVLLLTACAPATNNNSNTGNNNSNNNNTATGEPTKYIVAFLPNEADETGDLKDSFRYLIEEMEVALGDGYEIDYTIADDYAAVATAIRSGTAHFAWESGNTYATTHMIDDSVVPIVSYGTDDNKGYSSYISVHIDNASDFDGLTDQKDILAVLQDKSFAFVSPTSTSGTLFPSTTLYEYFGPDGEGLFDTREELLTTDAFFSEVQFSGDHRVSVQYINRAQVYAGAYCCQFAQEEGVEDNLKIISETFVPNGPLWTNTEFVDEADIDTIRDHFVQLTPENTTTDFYHYENGFFTAEQDPDWAQDIRFFAVDVEYYDAFYAMNNVK